jgi:hypothetical protein
MFGRYQDTHEKESREDDRHLGKGRAEKLSRSSTSPVIKKDALLIDAALSDLCMESLPTDSTC